MDLAGQSTGLDGGGVLVSLPGRQQFIPIQAMRAMTLDGTPRKQHIVFGYHTTIGRPLLSVALDASTHTAEALPWCMRSLQWPCHASCNASGIQQDAP